MTQKAFGVPLELQNLLRILGERIRIARKRRRITMQQMASRMFVTRKTLSRLERGESGVTLAVLASALWVLGMESELQKIMQPEKDEIGIFHERQRLPKRIRQMTADKKLDF